MSEIYFRAQEKQQESQRAGASALQAAKESLLHYATVPPPKVKAEASSGSFNAVGAPFRRFVLPCPDVIEGDGNLDGVADFSCAGADATAYQPLQSGSRFGRLPWRDDIVAGVRGVGNRDFRGSYGERFWYILSGNVADGNVSTNPHALLKLTSGWLSLTEDGELVSDRIAAIIIAPGAAEGAVLSEDLLFNGAAAASLLVAQAGDFYEAYLDVTSYLSLTTGALLISTRTDDPLSANSSAADRLAYLTIEELAANAGIDLVSDSDGHRGRNIYTQLDSGDGFLGVSDLLQVYLNRHGYLPEPAIFGEQSALSRQRLSGPLSSNGGLVAVTSTIRNISNNPDNFFVDYSAGVVENPLRFFQNPTTSAEGFTLAATRINGGGLVSGRYHMFGTFYPIGRSPSLTVTNFEDQRAAFVLASTQSPTVMVPMAGLPPVYLISSLTLSLSRSTQLNALPPYNIILANLDTGLNENPLNNMVVSDLSRDNHYPIDGLFGVYGSSAISLFGTDDTNVLPNLVINHIAPITLQSGGLFTVVLAAPAYGYFQGDTLIDLIAYSSGAASELSLLPPYGARVLLPAGTPLPLDSRSVAINLPADYRVNGSYSPTTGMYALAPTNQPVVITPSNINYVVEIPYAIPNHWPVGSGDFGFLPIHGRPVNNVATSFSVSLGIGGAVSHLPVDIGLYTEGRLILMPFPPPGRPSSLDVLTATVINTVSIIPLTVSLQTVTQLNNAIAAIASPLFIPEYAEFSLPVSTRVMYPSGGMFEVGVGFAFPQGAVAYFPPGAVINVVAPINAVMPGGRNFSNAALQTVEVALHHGGMLGVGNARAVLQDGFASGTGQELFDIELRAEAAVLLSAGVVRTLPANAILQPYTGRAIDNVGPVQLPSPAQLVSPAYMRAGFLTRERYDIHHVDRSISNGGGTGPIMISNLAALSSPNVTTALTTYGSTLTLAAEFDEDSTFLIPPNATIDIFYTALPDDTLVPVVPLVKLPPGTGIYDSDIARQIRLSITVFQQQPPAAIFSTNTITMALLNNFSDLDFNIQSVGAVVADLIDLIDSVGVLSISRPTGSTVISQAIENDINFNPILNAYSLNYFRGAAFILNSVERFPDASDLINIRNLSLQISPGTTVRHSGWQKFKYSAMRLTIDTVVFKQRLTTGYRKNHFALFLDNDIMANSPLGGTVLAAGGVVDVVNGHYWPPAGVQRLRRIADDLQMVSSGEMQIHLPARTALRMDFDQLDITIGGADPIVVATLAIASVVLQYSQYPALGTDNATATYSQLTVQTSLSLPPNAIILVPRGQPLDFLSEHPGIRGGFAFSPLASLYAETADYAHLPSGAVAIIPPGEEVHYATSVGAVTNTITLVIQTFSVTLSASTLSVTVISPTIVSAATMTGPGYLRLDGLSGGRAAFVNHPSHMPTPPLVFLSEDGNLRHGNVHPRFQKDIYARVPQKARLDMFGYMESRADEGIFANMLPADYAALLQDFPIGYAVAPECRRQAVFSGAECGAGPGLSFEVPGGEEVVLSEGMSAPSGMLLTVIHSDARLRVISQSLADFLSGTAPTATATVAAALINDNSGMVSFLGGGTIPAVGDVLRIELAPHHSATAMRAYLGDLNFSSPLNDIHYADIDGVLTVHVGGFIGDKYGAASGAITLINSTIFLGVGAPFRGGVAGQKIFGQGSYATVVLNGTSVELPIEDYSIVDALSYSAIGTLAMAASEVDAFGGVFATFSPYDQVSISGVGGAILTGVVQTNPIETASNTFIEMDPGYLWQGYLPPGGTLTFTENARINGYNGLSPNAYLRIQPTVRALNFFATGQERPEGLDGRGPAAAGSITFNAPAQDVYAGAVLSVVSEYREESQRVQYVFTGIRGLSNIRWPGPWPFTFLRPVNTPIIGGQLAGANTITLTTIMQTVNASSTISTYDATSITISATVTVYHDPALSITLIQTIDITNEILLVTIQSTMSIVIPGSTVTFNAAIAGKTEFTASISRYIISATVEFIDTHPGGFARASVTFINTILASASSQLILYARVRDNTGMRTVTATWNAPPLIWNRYSNPFQATTYTSRFDYGVGYDLWALPNVDDLSGNSESGYLNNFMCNGAAATAYFNPPPYQMAASLIAPAAAWTTRVAGANYQGLTLALPIDGVGGIVSPAEQRPPAYAPLTTPPNYLTMSTALPISVNLVTPKQAVSYSDLVFYMDTSYNKNLGFITLAAFITNYAVIPHVTGIVTSIVSIPLADLPPPQTLYFGDDFKIQGPGAIVPPFGGHNTVAVADVYASRSKLFSDLFGYPALHTVYDEMTGDCAGTDDCAAMFNTSDWIPIVGGVIALDGVNVSVAGASPRIIMPQPQALVVDKDGNTVTIYAGSLLLPKENLIFPAVKLDKDYILQIAGSGGVAGIDINPAAAPRPIRISRNPYVSEREVVLDEDFNFSPVTVAGAADCIVEPLFFDKSVIYNNFELNKGANIMNGTVVATASLTATYRVIDNVNEIIRYDGSFSRGFLLNEQGASLVADYYGGKSIYTAAHGFSPANIYNEFPRYNNDYPLGNPLSYHWMVPGTHFLPMGGQKDSTSVAFSAAGLSVTTNGQFSGLRLAHRINIPHVSIPVRAYQGAVRYPDRVDNMFQFPSGSDVMALNVDAGSWESIHPYLGLQAKGLKVVVMTAAAGVITVVGSLTVGVYNDAYVITDIGAKRLLHYQRAESLPGDRVFSAAEIYNNVWIRLPEGGRLEAAGGDVIYLPPDSIVNPLLGTYLSGDIFTTPGGATESRLKNDYLSRIVLNSTIEITRPAYVLPKGSRLVVANIGARINNVKAALFFSLTPKDGVSCPYGNWRLGEDQQQRVIISQTREGVSENLYQTAAGNAIVNAGHPCAWFDDPENTDGDRIFLYRGRRRNYVSNLRVREVSNDRTYTVGGQLILN